ncbi:MAG TPA: hypothetical protein VKY45_04905 [Marinilabiliaceae bacterium]|nr:hypothetical protein [Marinilabiliaceae bacterium]
MKVLFSVFLLIGIFGCSDSNNTIDEDSYVSTNKGENYFVLSDNKETASLIIDSNDFKGVIRAFGDLQNDIHKVSGKKPKLLTDNSF